MAVEHPSKLCVIVVQDSDGNRLVRALQEHGLPATRVASTGGFLRRGNATVLSGVTEHEVSAVSRLLHEQFPVAMEAVPAHTFPWFEEGEGRDELVDVRMGGAVLFVVDIGRFERL